MKDRSGTQAVIVAAARTPIGRAHRGSLVDIRADDLAVHALTSALAQAPGLDPAEIEDVMLGCSLPGGEAAYNIARVVSELAGLGPVPGTTVNRYCASSLQTTRMAFHAILAGEGDVFASIGVETVSRTLPGNPEGAPDTKHPAFAAAAERTVDARSGGVDWIDPADLGELADVYIGMGDTAENVAALRGISRHDQDEFAALSQHRAHQAALQGFWAREISPITRPDGTIIDTDDSPRPGTTVETLSGLRPVFREGGSVTAGNACPLNDGAAALVVMSDRRAAELGLRPLARILSTAVSGISPEIMGLGPVEASRTALARAGMTIGDVDLVEINEAFAAQVLPSARDLGVDIDRLNVHGGAIAVGHPFGMTGARITCTLINGLTTRDGQVGLETMCVGGGQGMAMVIERLS